MKIAIIVNLTKEKAISCSRDIIALLKKGQAEILMPPDCRNYYKNEDVQICDSIESMFEQSDAAITVGGDGTIIHAAKYAARSDTPLIGVNVGRLGFAANVEINEIESLTKLLSGDYTVESRTLLDVEVVKPKGSSHHLAVNDAVVLRDEPEQALCAQAKVILPEGQTARTGHDGAGVQVIVERHGKCALQTAALSHISTCYDIYFYIEYLCHLQNRIDVAANGGGHVVGRTCLAPAVAELTCAATETGTHVRVTEREDWTILVHTFCHHELEHAVLVLGDAEIGNLAYWWVELGEVTTARLAMKHRNYLHRWLFGLRNVKVAGAGVTDDADVFVEVNRIHL